MENQTQTPTPITPSYTMPPVSPMQNVPPTEMSPVVPPSYIPPEVPKRSGGEARMILPALLLVLIIGGAYYWYASRTAENPYTENTTPAPTVTVTGEPANNVEVTKADISAGSQTKLPEGFPTAIPIEQASITDSFRAVYKDQGVTQYTVSYTSKKTKDELWTIYTNYLAGASYKIDAANTNKTLGSIRASSDKNTISITISSNTSGSKVDVSLLAR
jgi:hypothetical protein